jgi:hypothetical protein
MAAKKPTYTLQKPCAQHPAKKGVIVYYEAVSKVIFCREVGKISNTFYGMICFAGKTVRR